MRVTIGDVDFRVNRLVCAAFHGRPPTPKHEAAHRDGKKRNNSARNLLWKTSGENERDKLQHGTYRRGIRKAGADHPLSKLTEAQRRQVRIAIGLQREIAVKFGITQPLVSMIKAGLYS
jgi:DNA-binding CsgD family transcriptional regulator